MSELTKALKETVGKGKHFTLVQTGNEKKVLLSVGGGIANVTLEVPFGWTENVEGCTDWSWKSNELTASFLISAIEGLPEVAAPSFIINLEQWDTGGLLLVGNWTQFRGRAKEGTAHRRNFLLDCGVLTARE